MRHLLAVLSAAIALTPIAHATEIDDFTLIGNGNTFLFSLPATADYQNHPHIVYFPYAVSGTVNGVGGYSFDVTFFTYNTFLGTETFSYFSADMPYENSLTLYGGLPNRYTYTLVPPYYDPQFGIVTNIFIPGTYNQVTRAFLSGSPEIDTPYTLTITPEAATSTTPEPATLTLLATGALGLLTTLRRRVLA